MSMEYVFPVLSVPDIAVHLGLLFNLPTSESFLKNPESNQWQKMMAHMLCVLTECPEDALLKLPSLCYEFENIDLHADSIPVIHLYQTLQYIMHDIGCSDFTAGDMFKPTPYKVKRICSALINYARFEQMRQPDIEQIKIDTESEKENYGLVQRENEEIKQKINQLKAQKAEQEPELIKIRELQESCNVLVNELMPTKCLLQKGINEVKTSVTENNAKAEEMRNMLLKRREETEMLSLKIVHSPSKVRAVQDNLKEQIKTLRDTGDRKQQRMLGLDQQIQNCHQGVVTAEKGIAVLEAINTCVNKENEIQNEINQVDDKNQELIQQKKELDASKSELQASFRSRQEKLASLSFKHQSWMNNLKEQEEMLKNDKELFMQKQDSNTAVKVELMQYKKRLERDDKEEQTKVEGKMEKMMDIYSQLLNKSDEYNRTFGEHWEKIRSCLNNQEKCTCI